MELFLSNNQDSYFLRMILSYTKCQGINAIELSSSAQQLILDGSIKLPGVPCLLANQPLTFVFSIAQYIAEASSTDQILVGKDNKDIAQVISVFEICRRMKIDELLNHYNDTLSPKMYLVGNHITLADIFLFTRIYNRVTDFTDSDKSGRYVHFFRWFNLIQNLSGIKEFNLNNGRIVIPSASPFVPPSLPQKKKK